MTTPLEKSFNLPSLNEIEKELNQELNVDDDEFNEEETEDTTNLSEEDILKTINTLNNSMKETRQDGIPKEVSEAMRGYVDKMSDIHEIALTNFQELIDGILAMEASQGAKFLAGAVKLLDIAKDAQNSSMDRVTKMARLQIEKEKHDAEMNGLVKKPKTIGDSNIVSTNNGEDSTNSEDVVLVEDRNTILERIRNKNNND